MLAHACFLELELEADLEVTAGSGVPSAIRIFAGTDISVELVEDIVYFGEESGFFGELVVGSQIPYPVVGIVSHSWLFGAAVTIHDAATVEGSIELVSGITNIDIKCAFRKFSVTVDVLSRLSLHMEIGVTNAGIPMLAEIFVQIEREAIDVSFPGIFISGSGATELNEVFGMGMENVKCACESITEFMVCAKFKGVTFFWVQIFVSVAGI